MQVEMLGVKCFDPPPRAERGARPRRAAQRAARRVQASVQAGQKGGADAAMPVYGHLYLKISNNAVNSATGTLIFKFIKP